MTLTLEHLAARPLSGDQMAGAMERIMGGAAPAAEVGAFLRALASRGETAEEIAAAVQSLRRYAVVLPLSKPLPLCDTCGTGGDGQGTFNVSTLTALAAAACGIRVSKHGNRAASSRCGSADVLEALGLNLSATPPQIARSVEEIGFGFCFAPTFHPAMKAVAEVRKQLGIRTIFNLVGPLANPAPLTFQLVGVSDGRLLEPMAKALQALGIRHGMVVHGADGLDEVTTTGPTQALEVRPSGVTPLALAPERYGIPAASLEALRGGDMEANAQIARTVLGGAPSPQRDVVAFNAGCAVYVADRAPTIQQGIAMATAALESGRALRILERAIELSRA